MLRIANLVCENRSNHFALDRRRPRFSWQLQSSERNIYQAAYRLRVAQSTDELWSEQNVFWDSGKILSDEQANITYDGPELQPKTTYYWTVTVWDHNEEQSQQGPIASFETAFFGSEDWKAKWIEPEQLEVVEEPDIPYGTNTKRRMVPLEEITMHPCPMLRRRFTVAKPVSRARLYATAHGLYCLEIDGKPIGDAELAPGNTAYKKYLQYQTYDLTNMLAVGEHAIGAILADGWWAGRVGITGNSCQYGNKLALLLQLEIQYADGEQLVICSDGSFKSSFGPYRYADLFIGEKYDATIEVPGWSMPEFDDSSWISVAEKDYGYDNLVAEYGHPVRVTDRVVAVDTYLSPKQEVVVDFGQVLAGRVEFRVRAPKGTVIHLKHVEIADAEGNIIDNIVGRYKNQEDTYICKGEGIECWQPKFTYHGFRYVKVTGWPGIPNKEDFTACVLQSDMSKTGNFRCSDPRLNQLQHNIYWSQKGNMISIPTDCPQREKAGWTGDVQVFAPTACYNMDMVAFFRRWLENVRLEQLQDGQVPIVVPFLKAYGNFGRTTVSSAGWGDVVTILPWLLYNLYGDKSFLTENYEMMQRWIAYIKKTAEDLNPEHIGEVSPERAEKLKYLWNTGFHYADWLAPSVCIDPATGDVNMYLSAYATMEIVPSFFYAYSCDLMVQIATLLGKPEDADYYRCLAEKVREAFVYEHFDEKGNLKSNLQGIHVLVLQMDMCPPKYRKNVLTRLLELIRENDGKLDTGFVSVPFLLDVLQKEGQLDMALDLLYQEGCPSWLYEVKMGATTMWEAWQAILPDGRPTSVSYNHYAFGAVGDWLYRNYAGIQSADVAYKKILISPLFDRLSFAEGAYDSIRGRIFSGWKKDKEFVEQTVKIPVNTQGEIHLPGAKLDLVREGGKTLSESYGILGMEQTDKDVVVTVGSGSYVFCYPIS